MINTNIRRKNIVRYLKENNPNEYASNLKLQKYLFFYETFSKVSNKDYSFECMKGYKNGPVFSEVYGDYKYEFDEFDDYISCDILENNIDEIDKDIASRAAFLVQILTQEELSDMTHQLNIWNSQKERIVDNNERHVELEEKNFDEEDVALVKDLASMYSTEFIETSIVLNIKNKNFVLSKKDCENISELQRNTLELLAQEKLMNPVFIEIGENGELLVD